MSEKPVVKFVERAHGLWVVVRGTAEIGRIHQTGHTAYSWMVWKDLRPLTGLAEAFSDAQAEVKAALA